MYKYIYILLLLCSSANAQELFTSVVYYKLTYLSDSLDQSSEKVEYCELLLNDSRSFFQTVNFGKTDSISQMEYRNGSAVGASMNDLIRYRSYFPVQILKDRDNVYQYEDHLAGSTIGKYMVIESSINENQWTIHQEIKKIEGLDCQKATIKFGNRIWDAWFAPSIPIPDGPYKFSGLPGLIVYMQDATKTWEFEMVGIDLEVKRDVYIDEYAHVNTKKMEKMAFYKLKRYLLDNDFELRFTQGLLNGVDKTVLEETKIKMRERAKNDNNWIELYP